MGHTITRCKSAPKTCNSCNSVRHTTADCPRGRGAPAKDNGKAPIKSLLPIFTHSKQVYMHVEKVKDVASSFGHALPPPRTEVVGKDSVLVSTPQEKESSSVTVHDLSHGLLYVDLKILKDFSMASHSSASASGDSSSDRENFSDEEDNPDDQKDKFIEVISKRFKKQSKRRVKAGVRGS